MSKPSAAWNCDTYSLIKDLSLDGFIYSYTAPPQIRLKYISDEDTEVLDTENIIWKIKYLGKKIKLNWKLLENLTPSLQALIKKFIVYKSNKLAPVSIEQYFNFFCSDVFLQNIKTFKLDELLRVLKTIYELEGASVSSTYQSCFLVFYNWGLKRGIEIFSKEILLILESLPKQKQEHYQLVRLNETIVTEVDEAIFLRHLQNLLEPLEEQLFDNLCLYNESNHITLRNVVIMLIAYELAPRPSQLYLSDSADFEKLKTTESDVFYNIKFQMIKQGTAKNKFTTKRALTTRTGRLLEKLIEFNNVLLNKQPELFSDIENKESNRPIFLKIKGMNYKERCTTAVMISQCMSDDHPLTFTKLRHHLAQSLAEQGAPQEVIQDKMGHESGYTAQIYIDASANIAELISIALGCSQEYQKFIKRAMTAPVMNKADMDDPHKLIRGSVGGANNLKYITNIGACDISGACKYNPIYSCYTCRKFHPFVDGPHQEVIDTLRLEALEFVDSVVDVKHSRPVTQLGKSIIAVEAVLKRIEEFKNV